MKASGLMSAPKMETLQRGPRSLFSQPQHVCVCVCVVLPVVARKDSRLEALPVSVSTYRRCFFGITSTLRDGGGASQTTP